MQRNKPFQEFNVPICIDCLTTWHSNDVDIFKKSISIWYDTFENLYRYIDIISIFLKCCYLANLLPKNEQKIASFVESNTEVVLISDKTITR